jgi:hypothetical protein
LSDQGYQPGDCFINSIVLAGAKGAFDCTNLIQMIQVYEDITLPGVNIEVVVLEDKELHSILPLAGEEVLVVDFNTPSLASYTHVFSIVSMNDANPSSNLKTKAYRITGVAPEVLKHKSKLVNKSYRTNNSEIVKDIFQKQLGSSKSLVTEKTKGIQEYIVTNKKPFNAIKDVLLRSVSEQNESSSYVFFENQEGYHFETIEKLFQQGPLATYTNSEVTADSVFRVIFRNILGYNLPDQFNTAEKIGTGGFATQMKTFDLKTLLFGNKDVKPDVDGMTRGMSGGMSSSKFKDSHSTPGITKFMPKDSIKPDTHIPDMIPKRSAYVANLDQGRVIIRIFGDSTITVGKMINLQIITNTGSTDPGQPHQLLAGNYLITKLIHIIMPADTKPRYTMILECVAGGYATGI